MNILIVTHYFLPHKGGIEFVAFNQAKELVKQGNSVTIVSTRIGDKPEEEIMDGVKIRRVNSWNFFENKFGIPYPVVSPKMFSVLLKESKKADIVHVHDFFYLPSFIGALTAKITKKPLVLMQHVWLVKHSKWIVNLIQKTVLKTYGKFIFKSAKKILVCNEDVGTEINQKDKTSFLENSVDVELFSPVDYEKKQRLRKKYNLPKKRPIVIFVGRIVEVKGADVLAKAKSNEYLLLFVGDGCLKDSLDADENLQIIDTIPQKKLRELYQLSDLFILPSKSEGFPLTALEAMASGLPIIVSDLPVYRKHLDVKNIKIISPTPENIKNSIKEILENKTLAKKMSSYSRKEAVRKFGWSNNAKKLLKVYEGAINENK